MHVDSCRLTMLVWLGEMLCDAGWIPAHTPKRSSTTATVEHVGMNQWIKVGLRIMQILPILLAFTWAYKRFSAMKIFLFSFEFIEKMNFTQLHKMQFIMHVWLKQSFKIFFSRFIVSHTTPVQDFKSKFVQTNLGWTHRQMYHRLLFIWIFRTPKSCLKRSKLQEGIFFLPCLWDVV